MEQLELVSFKLCPFVQRSVITLLHKNVPFTLTYIDLADPPGWFRQVSPLGKVPLLKVGDRAVRRACGAAGSAQFGDPGLRDRIPQLLSRPRWVFRQIPLLLTALEKRPAIR